MEITDSLKAIEALGFSLPTNPVNTTTSLNGAEVTTNNNIQHSLDGNNINSTTTNPVVLNEVLNVMQDQIMIEKGDDMRIEEPLRVMAEATDQPKTFAQVV